MATAPNSVDPLSIPQPPSLIALSRTTGPAERSGVKVRDVLTQFLVEAVTLAIAGGFIGILLGIGASAVISRLAGWNTVVGPGAVMLAVFFSALVGIVFGYYPREKLPTSTPLRLYAPSNV